MGSQAALPHIPRSRKVERENPGDVAGGAACEWPGDASKIAGRPVDYTLAHIRAPSAAERMELPCSRGTTALANGRRR